MAQLKASVLKADGREDGPEMEIITGPVGDLNAGAVLQATIAITVSGPGGDVPDYVDDDVTRMLLSHRSMMFLASEAEMQNCVGALETVVDDAVDHGLPSECAKMLRDIVFRTHLDVFRRGLLGDPPARVKPLTVRFSQEQGQAKPCAPPPAKACTAERKHGQPANSRNCRSKSAGDLRKRGDGVSQGLQRLPNGHGLSARQRHDRTGGYAHTKPGRQSASVRGRHSMVHAGYVARLLAGAAERGRPRYVHHGHAGGVVQPAPCSAGGAESYRIYPGENA